MFIARDLKQLSDIIDKIISEENIQLIEKDAGARSFVDDLVKTKILRIDKDQYCGEILRRLNKYRIKVRKLANKDLTDKSILFICSDEDVKVYLMKTTDLSKILKKIPVKPHLVI